MEKVNRAKIVGVVVGIVLLAYVFRKYRRQQQRLAEDLIEADLKKKIALRIIKVV